MSHNLPQSVKAAAAAAAGKERNMAEEVSSSEVQAVKRSPKRRRILDPSTIVPVPVYSNKVKSSLQLKMPSSLLPEKTSTDDDADDSLWAQFSSVRARSSIVTLSDSEDENVQDEAEHAKKPEATRSPSPPPPESPVRKQSRKVKQKLSELDRRLRAVNSLLSPEPPGRRSRRRRRAPVPQEIDDEDDDDVIIVSPGLESSPNSSSVREIPLKIRCRAEVHRIPVLSSTPLRDVVTQLSVILNVPPPRLLLLREEVELPTESTVSELGLGIADILECMVMAAEDKSQSDSSGSVITVRLQSKDRHASQEFSLHREAPLSPIFSQYLSKISKSSRNKVSFHFDGSKVTGSQTPAQLDMEDGDIIEVWI